MQRGDPSTAIFTSATPTSSLASALIVTGPETVAPSEGATIDTEGGDGSAPPLATVTFVTRSVP